MDHLKNGKQLLPCAIKLQEICKQHLRQISEFVHLTLKEYCSQKCNLQREIQEYFTSNHNHEVNKIYENSNLWQI